MLVVKHLSLLRFLKPRLKMPAGDIRYDQKEHQKKGQIGNMRKKLTSENSKGLAC